MGLTGVSNGLLPGDRTGGWGGEEMGLTDVSNDLFPGLGPAAGRRGSGSY